MAFDLLPHEMLSKILRVLPPSERLDSALTCRTFADTLTDSPLLDDIWLVINGLQVEKIVPAIIASRRQYRNIRIIGADLSGDTMSIFTDLGEHVRKLAIIECKFKSDVFYSILRLCPKLQSLELIGFSSRYAAIEQIKFPDNVCGGELPSTLLNLRSFTTNFHMTPGVLDQLLRLMPNMTSLHLQHSCSCRLRKSPLNDLLRALPMLTKLDLVSLTSLEERDLTELARMYSQSLLELRLYCAKLTKEAFCEIARFSVLRHLALEDAMQLTDEALEQLVRCVPNLELLAIPGSPNVGDEGFAHICALEKLRTLDLFVCKAVSRDALRGLGKIKTLQVVNLQLTNFDTTDIRSMACLEDLRSLKLGEISSKSFQFICETFTKLECLFVDCPSLTDLGGVKIRNLKHMKEIFLRRSWGLTDLTFVEGFRFPELETLAVMGSPLTDKGLASIAAHHGRLRQIILSNCANIADAGLMTLLRSQRFLRQLHLLNCRSLTDELLRELSDDICPRLELLELDLCPFGDRAVRQIIRRRPFLRVLHVKQPNQRIH